MTTSMNLGFILIPEGEVTIGSDPYKDRNSQKDEQPLHTLVLSDYYIMKNPVTNAQYMAFVEATDHRKPLFWTKGVFPEEKADHPVVGVSFHDAVAFCRWASDTTGLPIRLPTEPEWEKAARGSDARMYPWGDDWDASLTNTREGKLGSTSPVGKYSPEGDSPFGISDPAGNVQHWISNLYGAYPYDPSDGREAFINNLDRDSTMPLLVHETGTTSVIDSLEASINKSVIRGSSWRESKVQSRCAYRSWAAPMHRSDDTGFRCCYEPVK